jgi:hypothetical protein
MHVCAYNCIHNCNNMYVYLYNRIHNMYAHSHSITHARFCISTCPRAHAYPCRLMRLYVYSHNGTHSDPAVGTRRCLCRLMQLYTFFRSMTADIAKPLFFGAHADVMRFLACACIIVHTCTHAFTHTSKYIYMYVCSHHQDPISSRCP